MVKIFNLKKLFKNEYFYVLVLLIILLFLSISSLKNDSVTYDEWKYLQAGKEIWTNNDWHKDIKNAYGPPYAFFHPPLTYYVHGSVSYFVHPGNDKLILIISRLMMQPILILFALSIYIIAKRIYGKKAGFVALILFVFNTEILTHGRLIGIDLTLALMIFLSLVSFYYFLRDKSMKSVFFAGLFLGLTFLTKYNSLILLPFYFISLISYVILIERKLSIGLFLKTILLIVFSIIILNLGYGLKGSFQTPSTFRSQTFIKISNNKVGKLILLLFPEPFLVGSDFQYSISKEGWISYFMGITNGGGNKIYFIVAFFIKTAIPLLLLSFTSLLFSKKKYFEWYLISAVIYFFVFISLFNKINIGLRYLLMIYPLLIILISSYFSQIGKNRKLYWFLIPLIVWQICETLSIYPHYFVYFNELIGGPKNGYKYLADSNIDFGQDDEYAKKYFKLNSDVIVNPEYPIKGKVAVNVNYLNLSHDQNFWLRKLNKKPIVYLNYSWLIFDITQDDLKELN